MGSIAELYFSDYPVNETKNYLDQWILKEEIGKLKKIEEHDAEFVKNQREIYSKFGNLAACLANASRPFLSIATYLKSTGDWLIGSYTD